MLINKTVKSFSTIILLISPCVRAHDGGSRATVHMQKSESLCGAGPLLLHVDSRDQTWVASCMHFFIPSFLDLWLYSAVTVQTNTVLPRAHTNLADGTEKQTCSMPSAMNISQINRKEPEQTGWKVEHFSKISRWVLKRGHFNKDLEKMKKSLMRNIETK